MSLTRTTISTLHNLSTYCVEICACRNMLCEQKLPVRDQRSEPSESTAKNAVALPYLVRSYDRSGHTHASYVVNKNKIYSVSDTTLQPPLQPPIHIHL